ncbi:MAG: NAD kinase [Pseudomonadota bacterium]
MPFEARSLSFLSSDVPDAREATDRLRSLYDHVEPDQADIIIALGGDGFMLQTQLDYMNSGKPIFGMNKGTIGFLMNEYREDGLPERLEGAQQSIIHPLKMTATDTDGNIHTALAVNEVSTFRQSHQAAKLRILIDGQPRMNELVCDGAMVATPQGSTAYNLSAHGPILPLNAPLLALTPVSPFRPRNWRGALLPNTVSVQIDVLEPKKRPVNAVADHTEIKSILSVTICEDRESTGRLLFDPEHPWDERILKEQFQI